MRQGVLLVAGLCVFSLVAHSIDRGAASEWGLGKAAPRHEVSPLVASAFDRLPLSFEANEGQTDARVRFLSRGRGYAVFLTPTEAVLVLQVPSRGPQAVLRMRLVGAAPCSEIAGREKLAGTSHYFLGNRPEAWRANVPHYGRVVYRDVYPGIDLAYYGNQQQLEYDFVISPGGDPSIIRLVFGGADGIELDASGGLVLRLAGGEVHFNAPIMYQEFDGEKRRIAGGYVLHKEAGAIGFRVDAFDRARPLVIDPTLVYSTFLGGSKDDECAALAYDGVRNVFITGYTVSAQFPTTSGAYDTQSDTTKGDAFVMKLNTCCSGLVYSTFLGGSGSDQGTDIALDAQGSAFVTGVTESNNFPTTAGAYDRDFNGGDWDIFVTKLTPEGNDLVYSTYLGGRKQESGPHIALDLVSGLPGSAYIAGSTSSDDFPTTRGAYQERLNGVQQDGFVTKLNVGGTALTYSTLLGGTNTDEINDIAMSASVLQKAYVAGSTSSLDLPTTPDAIDRSYNGGTADAFVATLSGGGNDLEYSTYLGGSGHDAAFCLARGNQGGLFVAGTTTSAGFPVTANAYDRNYDGSGDGFVAKLDAGLAYCTYLGGSGYDRINAVALDSIDQAYVTGRTESVLFPTTAGAYDISLGGVCDAFVSKFNATGSHLLYSTFLGGSSLDRGNDLVTALQDYVYVYVTGATSSFNFPFTAGALDGGYNGNDDGFLTQFRFEAAGAPVLSVTPTSMAVPAAAGVGHIYVDNISGGSMLWTATVMSGASWLQIMSGASGTGAGTVAFTHLLNANPTSRIGTIRIAASSASNSPVDVTITQGGDTAPVIRVEPANRDVGAEASFTTFYVSNQGGRVLEWTAQVVEGAEWLTVTTAKVSGNGTIAAAHSANGGAALRVGRIRVSSTNAVNSPVEATVTQAGSSTPTLTVTPSDQAVGATAGETEFDVTNTGHGALVWSASVTQGNDWLFIRIEGAIGDGKIRATYQANATGDARVGEIMVQAPGAVGSPTTVTVTQSGNTIPILWMRPTVLSAGAGGATTGFEVDNTGFGTLAWNVAVTTGAAWLSVSPASGTNRGTVTVSCLENLNPDPRTGIITVTAAGALGSPAEVTVTQAGYANPVLVVSPPSGSVGSAGGTAAFTVSNGGTGSLVWNARPISGSEWAALSVLMHGSGSGVITVTCQPNSVAESRTAVIRVVAEGAVGSPVEVTVTQAAAAAPELEVTPDNRNVPGYAGTTTFAVRNAGSGTLVWQASVFVGAEWFSVTTTKVVGSGTVHAAYQTNDTGATRIGVIAVDAGSAAGSPKYVTVTQAPAGALSAPIGVSASDGAYADRVRITWNPVAGASQYRVYRNTTDNAATATVLSPLITMSFYDDFTALAPTTSSGGCTPGAPTNHYYYYWVKAFAGALESGLSIADRGYRGRSKLAAEICEAVLPSRRNTDGHVVAQEDSLLCIRLRSEHGIDAAGVWGWVRWSTGESWGVEWLPCDDGFALDGWVVYRPTVPWNAGETVEMTVGAHTVSGQVIEPVSYVFVIGSGEQYPARTNPMCEPLWQPSVTGMDAASAVAITPVEEKRFPALPEGRGGVFAVSPNCPYSAPQRVWLPLPYGVSARDIRVYYYHDSGQDDAGWYPAEEVEGWMISGSYSEIEVNGVRYVGFLVRHGGTVQLGAPPELIGAADIGLGIGGDAVLMLAVGAVLLLARKPFTPSPVTFSSRAGKERTARRGWR